MVAALGSVVCKPSYFKAISGISVRLILQPSHSIEMSTVKVKFAIVENIPLWMLSARKERAGSGFVPSVHLFLLI